MNQADPAGLCARSGGSERLKEVLLGPPPPEYLLPSAIEQPKSGRSGRPCAMVGGAKRREHVWRADGNLLQDLRSLAGWPAKILNSELLAIRRLRDCAPGFVLLAMLRARLALLPSNSFAGRGEVGVHRRPHCGVETNASASIVGNLRDAAWFFRRRVGTSTPFRQTRVGAIRSKPAKERSEGAGDDGKCDDQARLPRHRPETDRHAQLSAQAIQSARPHARPNDRRNCKRCLPIEAIRNCFSPQAYRQSYIQQHILRCVNLRTRW